MYPESDLVPISALQHYLYCPRQCALIHVERVWSENLYTAEGRILHKQADSQKVEQRGVIRIVRSLLLRSLNLGLTGKADVVEFNTTHAPPQPFPVEYKRGRPKKNNCDAVQLCAQAMCLEEMLCVAVPCGALFYGQRQRRTDVSFDETLRAQVRETTLAVHELLATGASPSPVNDDRCAACSLAQECVPQTASSQNKASRYLTRIIETP